jgi:hypothetical protein
MKDIFGEVNGKKARPVAKAKAAAAAAAAAAKPAAKKAPAKKVPAKKAEATSIVRARAAKTVAKTGKPTKAKVAAVRKPRAKKVVEAIKPVKTKFTKAGLIEHLADRADTDKATVREMLSGLNELMLGSIAPRGVGQFVLPGMLRIVTKKIPARKGGKMVMNRFTGEMVKQKAKAAFVRVKVRPLTGLKNAAL